jgi:hypothetical protein
VTVNEGTEEEEEEEQEEEEVDKWILTTPRGAVVSLLGEMFCT